MEDRRVGISHLKTSDISKNNDQHSRRTRVLVVDDDPIVLSSICELLTEHGYTCTQAIDLASCEDVLNVHNDVDVILLDVSFPDGSGIDRVRSFRAKAPHACVILMTGYVTLQSAVHSMRAGAADFLTKPVVDKELIQAIERALMQRRLEGNQPVMQPSGASVLDRVLGNDPRMQRIMEMVESVAPSKATVLMAGESGVGKSLIARAIHEHSPRLHEPFVELSCGSIPETLLESELFGHVKGAFTGAHSDKVGRFLAADKGTIFLDEINSASPAMQLKLLRVLQERRFEPVGTSETIEVDVRVVLATNQPLDELVAAGTFRQDLYYRINVVGIDIPPLRERMGDIVTMAKVFLDRQCAELGKQIVGFSDDALGMLMQYSFPGNVRELENIVARAVVLTSGQVIHVSDLPETVIGNAAGSFATGKNPSIVPPSHNAHQAWTPMPLADRMLELETTVLRKALEAHQWNRGKTAQALCINRTTLYKKMKQLGIVEPTDGSIAGNEPMRRAS